VRYLLSGRRGILALETNGEVDKTGALGLDEMNDKPDRLEGSMNPARTEGQRQMAPSLQEIIPRVV
jgi:hypothetical protein